MTEAPERDYEFVDAPAAPSLAEMIARLEELRPAAQEFNRLNRQVRKQLERRGILSGQTVRFAEPGVKPHDVSASEISGGGHYVERWTTTKYTIAEASE